MDCEGKMSTITLGDIRAHGPCTSGWAKLTKALGTTDLTTELSIGDIVIANGLNDALWALRCLPRREALAAVMPAVKRASVFTTDQRVHDCISAVDLWLAGDDSVDLAAAAREAAAESEAEWAAAEWVAARAAEWVVAAAAAIAESAAAAAEAARAAAAIAEAAAAAEEARAAWAAERDMQASDLLAMFPPIRLKAEAAA